MAIKLNKRESRDREQPVTLNKKRKPTLQKWLMSVAEDPRPWLLAIDANARKIRLAFVCIVVAVMVPFYFWPLGDSILESYALEDQSRATEQSKDQPAQENLKVPAEKAPQASEQTSHSLEDRAKNGEPDAQYQLGKAYAQGNGVTRDIDAAYRWFIRAADQGHMNAQMVLGRMFKEGLGIQQSDAAAVDFYRRAADQGNVEAAFQAGNLMMNGMYVSDRKPELGKRYLMWAGEQGHGEAAHLKGHHFMYGKLNPPESDLQNAAKWFQTAAHLGDKNGQRDFGSLYYHGTVVGKDLDKAAYWHILAAEQGSIIAMQYLQRAAGEGSEQARQWLRANPDIVANIQKDAEQ